MKYAVIRSTTQNITQSAWTQISDSGATVSTSSIINIADSDEILALLVVDKVGAGVNLTQVDLRMIYHKNGKFDILEQFQEIKYAGDQEAVSDRTHNLATGVSLSVPTSYSCIFTNQGFNYAHIEAKIIASGGNNTADVDSLIIKVLNNKKVYNG